MEEAEVGGKLHIAEQVLSCEVGGEAVLLDAASGRYYGFGAVGARLWELLKEHGEIEPVVRQLMVEYEVDEGRLRADVGELVGVLRDRGLLVGDDGDTP
ncbi:MAG: PqqD family protein [Acidobacteriota bacterium]